MIESDEQEWERKDKDFEPEGFKDLYGKLKEIHLKTYVGNKLIQALLAKKRDVVAFARYSVELSENPSEREQSYVL